MARAATAATALHRVRRQSPSSATGWGRDPVTVARSLQVDFDISAEQYGEFRGVLSDEAIRSFVREAMTDLRGSINREALPEMAMRLARATGRRVSSGRRRVSKSSPTNKSFVIPKQLVWEAYQRVRANQGAPGVDGQAVAAFEADLGNNLYRIWNRMSSGTYFPLPVRAVQIPKPQPQIAATPR